VHAAGKFVRYVQAEILRPVPSITVTQRLDAIPPAAALGATSQGSIGVNELVVRVGFPVGRFTGTRNYDAGPGLPQRAPALHGGGQVHQRGHAAKHTLGVVNQPHQFPQGRAPAQIDHSPQLRMVVPKVADLYEQNPASKVIDDLLVAFARPPLDGQVMFAAGGDNPEWRVLSGQLMHL